MVDEVITTKQLFSSKYKFKHLQIETVEVDDEDNVLVFKATFVTTKLPGKFMSDGHIEINQTLWDQQSTKRPPGYRVLWGC